MNARFYLPSVGRFASADSIVPNPGNPQSFNRYSYVKNSPINRVDPTGHKDIACPEQQDVCEEEDDGLSGFRAEFEEKIEQLAEGMPGSSGAAPNPKAVDGFIISIIEEYMTPDEDGVAQAETFADAVMLYFTNYGTDGLTEDQILMLAMIFLADGDFVYDFNNPDLTMRIYNSAYAIDNNSRKAQLIIYPDGIIFRILIYVETIDGDFVPIVDGDQSIFVQRPPIGASNRNPFDPPWPATNWASGYDSEFWYYTRWYPWWDNFLWPDSSDIWGTRPQPIY